MYPRTAVDNAKAVRQNAHTLQGQLAAAAGKKFARHMPTAVGAWLCGLYDSDRSVVEATQNALRQVFNTPEKIQNIRKAYQQPILEYCRSAIDKESAQTLSDERTVSKDDAEAKYSRVISACISLLGSLLANLQQEELAKHQSDYESLLGDKKLWEFASYGDASIRRSTHRFLKTCLAKEPGRSIASKYSKPLILCPEAVQANLDSISKSYLSVALNSDQTSSAFDYVDTITLLTQQFPAVWTAHYKSKTTADRRLRQFLRKGSQSGPREFWSRMRDLFAALPKEVLPGNAADAAELLGALHGGITRKDESRMSLESAFAAYLDITDSISKTLLEDDQMKLLREMVLPLLTQYLRPSADNSQWNLPPQPVKVLARTMHLKAMPAILEERWPEFTQQFVGDIKTSAPEQSKDYERSQTSLIRQATRLFLLQEQAATGCSDLLRDVFGQSNSTIVSEALSVMRNRNGKPYGAAGVISEFLVHGLPFDEATKHQLSDFIHNNLPGLILSPSSSYLVDMLYLSPDSTGTVPKDAWTAAVKTIMKEPDSPHKAKALEAILTSDRIPKSFDLATEDAELQQYIKASVQGAVEGSLEWDSFNRILQSPAKILSPTTTDEVLATMTQSLSLSQQAPYALQGLRQIVRQSPSMLKAFLSTPQGSHLLQGLLLASESPSDDIAQSASSVSASIRTVLAAGTDTKQSVYDLIQQGLREATKTSVSVETLVDLAKQLVQPGSSWEEMAKVFPSVRDWASALSPFKAVPPKTSLAITNPLGGAIYLIDPNDDDKSRANKIPTDADGYSSAYRIAQYVTRLFKESELFPITKVPDDSNETRDNVFGLISDTIQLADDNLGLAGANGLWAEYNLDTEAEAAAFISDAQAIVQAYLKLEKETVSDPATFAAWFDWATEQLTHVDAAPSAHAYYSVRGTSVRVSDAIELFGWKNSDTARMQEVLRSIRKSKGECPSIWRPANQSDM
jgi:hypothetical protein